VHGLPAVRFYVHGNEIEVFTQAPMSGVLVLARETAVSGHIRVQDGGKFSRQAVFHV
jgi:hypothetical protein